MLGYVSLGLVLGLLLAACFLGFVAFFSLLTAIGSSNGMDHRGSFMFPMHCRGTLVTLAGTFPGPSFTALSGLLPCHQPI